MLLKKFKNFPKYEDGLAKVSVYIDGCHSPVPQKENRYVSLMDKVGEVRSLIKKTNDLEGKIGVLKKNKKDHDRIGRDVEYKEKAVVTTLLRVYEKYEKYIESKGSAIKKDFRPMTEAVCKGLSNVVGNYNDKLQNHKLMWRQLEKLALLLQVNKILGKTQEARYCFRLFEDELSKYSATYLKIHLNTIKTVGVAAKISNKAITFFGEIKKPEMYRMLELRDKYKKVCGDSDEYGMTEGKIVFRGRNNTDYGNKQGKSDVFGIIKPMENDFEEEEEIKEGNPIEEKVIKKEEEQGEMDPLAGLYGINNM